MNAAEQTAYDRERAAQDPLFDPFATVNSRDPYSKYRVMRDEHRVYYVAARNVWVVSRYDDVKAAARDWQAFASSPSVGLDDTQKIVGPGAFIDMEPPEHDVFRKMLRGHFTPKAVSTSYTPTVELLVDEILDEAASLGEVDLAGGVAWRVPVAVLCHLLGFPREDWKSLSEWFRDLVSREPGNSQAPESANRAAGALGEYLAHAIEARKRAPADGVLDAILAQRASGAIGDEEVRGLCFLLFAAGTATTASLISNAFKVLADHPYERRFLAENPSAIAQGVEEILRYDPPVHYLARRAVQDVELFGTHIPEGGRLVLLYGSANRDERYYERPDSFDLARDVKRHLAFGEGIHFCLGAPLARLEARVVLERFLARFPDYQIVGEGQRSTDHTARGFFHLPATLSA